MRPPKQDFGSDYEMQGVAGGNGGRGFVQMGKQNYPPQDFAGPKPQIDPQGLSENLTLTYTHTHRSLTCTLTPTLTQVLRTPW